MTAETTLHSTLAKLRVATLGAVILTLTMPLAARAAACGDDVAGLRVACACGDVVVSDTRLRAEDPVVRQRCEGDGLVVSAPSGAPSIRLDLAGLSLTGSGSGVGIRVVRGGDGGASLIGDAAAGTAGGARAMVSGFHTGLRAHGRRGLREVRGITFSGNEGDGVRLHGVETRVAGVGAAANGADGLRIRGHGASIDDVTTSDNGREGLRVTGRDVVVGRVRIEDDHGAGPAGATAPSEAVR